jgi:hypothetical protein
MTERYLDISCPLCNKRDEAGWCSCYGADILMHCNRCGKSYVVKNDGTKFVYERER